MDFQHGLNMVIIMSPSHSQTLVMLGELDLCQTFLKIRTNLLSKETLGSMQMKPCARRQVIEKLVQKCHLKKAHKMKWLQIMTQPETQNIHSTYRVNIKSTNPTLSHTLSAEETPHWALMDTGRGVMWMLGEEDEDDILWRALTLTPHRCSSIMTRQLKAHQILKRGSRGYSHTASHYTIHTSSVFFPHLYISQNTVSRWMVY